MARTSTAQRLFQRAATNADFVLLPLAVQGFWLRLAALMLAGPTPGRWSFLGSVAASVSRLVSVSEPISETEAETHLATLAAIGMLEWDRAANTILLPGVAADSARAEAARNNGKRGGRPLKGESHEAYLARKQGTLKLPIEGGKTETQETERKPTRESSRAVVLTPSRREEVTTAHEAPAWVSLGQEVAEIAGLDPTSGGYDFRPVQAWLAKPGASAELIRRTVRSVASRKGYADKRIRTLTYFDQAIERALQQRAAPAWGAAADKAETVMDTLAEEAYRARLVAWAQNPAGPRPVRAAA